MPIQGNRIILRETTEADVDEVWTEPRPDNAAALKLYQRCGLRPKTRPADMKPDRSYWALERVRWKLNR